MWFWACSHVQSVCSMTHWNSEPFTEAGYCQSLSLAQTLGGPLPLFPWFFLLRFWLFCHFTHCCWHLGTSGLLLVAQLTTKISVVLDNACRYELAHALLQIRSVLLRRTLELAILLLPLGKPLHLNEGHSGPLLPEWQLGLRMCHWMWMVAPTLLGFFFLEWGLCPRSKLQRGCQGPIFLAWHLWDRVFTQQWEPQSSWPVLPGVNFLQHRIMYWEVPGGVPFPGSNRNPRLAAGRIDSSVF